MSESKTLQSFMQTIIIDFKDGEIPKFEYTWHKTAMSMIVHQVIHKPLDDDEIKKSGLWALQWSGVQNSTNNIFCIFSEGCRDFPKLRFNVNAYGKNNYDMYIVPLSADKGATGPTGRLILVVEFLG